jgi:hypothetical protein
MSRLPALVLASWLSLLPVAACDLCAIYSADNARGESATGLTFTLSEQFTSYRTILFNGDEVEFNKPDWLDSSMTHLVPTYNFSKRVGISLNVPLNYRSFRRTDLRYSRGSPPVNRTETGSELDLGDVALVGRWAVWQMNEMDYAIGVTLLGGIKFPTGDTERIEDEVSQTRIFDSFLPPGTPHDPLSHSIASLHQHNLSPGSGSFDGVFGLTVNSRWWRLFLNAQFQYYARTKGEDDFRYGDEVMVSGGPGGYLLLSKKGTLSLQANAVYDSMARDEVLGRISNRTGMTAWYLGPQLSFTVGNHFSGNAGVDIPLHITNNGFQNVPDYRVHAGASWRF